MLQALTAFLKGVFTTECSGRPSSDDTELPAGGGGLSPTSSRHCLPLYALQACSGCRQTSSDSMLLISIVITGSTAFVMNKSDTELPSGATMWPQDFASLIPSGVVREQPLRLGTVCEISTSQTMFSRTRFCC